MTEQINCPFCDSLIDVDAKKCPSCNALFDEPKLNDIQFKELAPFVAIDFLTFGFFSTIWFFINTKAINRLTENTKDGIKLNWLVLLLAINGVFYLFFFYKQAAFLALFSLIQCIIYIALSYRVLRIVQKYTEKVYSRKIEFNPHFMVIFNVFYLVHFLDSYKNRVLGEHKFFDWKSPQAIMLIILLVIIVFCLRFYNEICLVWH